MNERRTCFVNNTVLVCIGSVFESNTVSYDIKSCTRSISTDNDQNSIVIGFNANGLGSNSVVLGNDSISTTALKGSVGIGTTTPAEKLTVAGTTRITGNTTLASALTLSALTGGLLTTDSSGVVSTTTISASVVDADTLDFTEFKDALALDASTDIAVDGSEVLSITNTGTGNSFVVNDAASDATPFTITSAGSVGIQGAPDSAYTLDVRNPGTTVLVGVHSNSTGRPAGIEFGTGSATNNYGFVGYDGSTINFGSVYAFGVDTTISNKGTEYIRLTGGNVGIGTTTPAYPLTVAGDINTTGTIRVNGTALAIDNLSDAQKDTTNNNLIAKLLLVEPSDV